jgi:hypothetical protein
VKHLFMRSYLIAALQLSCLIARAHKGVQTRADRGRDRGANVVETIIIVAGFAILAAGIYAAVAGKVHTWIAKMP